ncbi:SRPBCC family protein [Paracraurococcus ruber]|uniref:MxaD family protein n=1 Tax=Paracraurococcus ruber TaxID=77675 RepID=A0ABS1D1J0_9PROT|nr:SRPBCC family protein [Paracraurococcus ruber]MBK1660689.1 MxaD family protein [Paracraurococcus ruber]TDG31600.1 SRPBCC family protein [Paracraurococcus ruber]
MASIRRETLIAVPPEAAWDAIRDVGALHRRLVPGFVTETRLEPGARLVTFASGRVLREVIVACDDAARRLVWSVRDPWFEHHNASLVVEPAAGGARVTWTADLLPDREAALVAGLMEGGLAGMKATLEAA